MDTRGKILGSLVGAATGDAMGAATELLTMKEITATFGYVKTFMGATSKSPAKGLRPGTVTDDFSAGYYLARTLLNAGGVIDENQAKEALLSWASHDEYLCFVGPTTRAALSRLRNGEIPDIKASCSSMSATNGAAMKIFGLALLYSCSMEILCRHVLITILPTHANSAAIAGSCAIACAVQAALEIKSREAAATEKIIEAAMYGARTGNRLADEQGLSVPTASVEKRIALAAEIGYKNRKKNTDLLHELSDIIGTGIAVTESVPCVFGIMAAEQNNPLDGIYMAVNIGGDTDTIGSMYGAVAGALHGASAFPADYLSLLESVNSLDIHGLADDIAAFREKQYIPV
jgi:ADP-ribosylglycohydrolase